MIITKFKTKIGFTAIPAKILIVNNNPISHHLFEDYERAVSIGTPPKSLQNADTRPEHRKNMQNLKRSIETNQYLPDHRNIFETAMHAEIYTYMNTFLLHHLLGTHRDNSKQYNHHHIRSNVHFT